ncbi:MAG: hypothetical protein HY247_01090 [archaeon]|nr:MAG: hypothetical protein HY247_01090 [archaeon]
MAKAGLKLLIGDVLILVAGYLVTKDLQARVAYAAAERYSPSFSYSILTKYFDMIRNSVTLQSPLTLDWIQVLAFAFIIVNGWYAYGFLRGRSVPMTK